MTQLLMTVKLNKKPKQHLTPLNSAALSQLAEPAQKPAKPAQGQTRT